MVLKLERALGVALLGLLLVPARALWAISMPTPGQRLALGDAIQLSLENHPRRMAARSEAGAEEQRVAEAQAAMLPQVYGIAQYLGATQNGIDGTNYLNPGFIPRHSGAGGEPQAWSLKNNYLGGVAVSQYLLDFGRVRGQIAEQTDNADAAQAQLKLTDLDLVFETSQRYFAMLAATELVKVYGEAITERKEQLHESQVKAQAGLTSQIDVYTAQAELARARVQLLDARNNVAKAKAALDNAMGLGIAAPDYRLASNLNYSDVSGSIKDYFTTALRLRPDLRALEDEARAAGARITEYRSDFLPTVSAIAGYSAIGSGLPAINNYDVGVTITWPIFNGMLTTHQVEEARLRREAIEHSITDLRQHILLEVKTAFLDWQTALQRIHQAEVTLNAARVELELAQKRYTAGLGNIIELTDAERFFIQDKAAYVDALYTFAVAKAGLQRATGESLEGR
ncbi:MAG TPA: TolC family protein [Candidatus Binataceae bacterium]|nr:TolC family protein [Candidatus Binataceae bacterium]